MIGIRGAKRRNCYRNCTIFIKEGWAISYGIPEHGGWQVRMKVQAMHCLRLGFSVGAKAREREGEIGKA